MDMRKAALEKLRALGKYVADKLQRGEEPVLEIPVRSLSNTIWDEKAGILRLGSQKSRRRLLDRSSVRAYAQTLYLAHIIAKAIEEGDYPTIRDLYYAAKHTITWRDPVTNRRIAENSFEEQSESDSIIQDIEVMLGILREQMGIMADAKGKIVGNMVIESKGHRLNLAEFGVGAYAIPPNADDINILKVEADYVLVIEKDAVFNRLNNEEFWKKHNCIIVTGKGQPDRGTRRMVRRLWEEFGLPVYVLADADPYGFYIYSVYKCGSISLSYESERLAVPEAKFIGVYPSDIYRYKIPKNFIIKATERDLKRARELLNYPWFANSKLWRRELELFLKKKEKVEIEAFSGFGLKFLTEKYIPKKIKMFGSD